MRISLYGMYFIPYVIELLKKEGHSILINKFDPDVDICVLESRFYMYDIYKYLKIIKKKKIKLINFILDIPIFSIQKNYPLNTKYKTFLQVLYNFTHKNRFLFNRVNRIRCNHSKNKIKSFFSTRIQQYFNNHYGNRVFYLKHYKTFLRHSDLNLSISNYTQKLIKKFLKINSIVCYPCVNSDYLLNLPKEKIEYDTINISRIVAYKRQVIFAKAVKRLGLNGLVLGHHSDKSIKLECPHFYIENHQKAMKLLNQASFYVDPSEFEGFGMTPVEAAFLGKITIVSNTYVHREI